MRRREFVGLVGSTAFWPFASRAQPASAPVIGFLGVASPEGYAGFVKGFRNGLKETGFVDGDNVSIVYRWAEGRHDRLPELAADLVSRHVSVVLATGGSASALAAKQATATLPIVFTLGSDPVKSGIVPSFNRPGGNITGVTLSSYLLEAKRVELIHELVPGADKVAVLLNSGTPDQGETQFADVEAAARKLGLRSIKLKAGTENEIDQVIAGIAETKKSVLIVSSDSFFLSRRNQIVTLVTRYAIPTIFEFRQFAEAGGLMSYGTDLVDSYRQAGVYAGKILRGMKPGDLPVLQPIKFEFVINLKAAKSLGIAVPGTMQVAADEIIE